MSSSNILEYGVLSSDGDLLADPMAWSSMRKLSNELLFHNTFADASRLDAVLAGQTGALADAIRAAIGDRSDGFMVPSQNSSGAATGAPKPEENGSGDTTAAVAASGNQNIDGLLSGVRWSDGFITYSDPNAVSDYQAGHPEPFNGFAQMTAQQMIAVHFSLNSAIFSQPGGAAGFGVEGFTNLGIDYAGSGSGAGTIRVANTTDPGTAYAYYPNNGVYGGDAFFGPSGNTPTAGNYDWHTVIHELGHALGLKHGQETGVYGALPTNVDSLEYSVMTYRTFIGDDTSGYNYETWGAPQTFMMLDIAALQYMYGADFTTNSGNTIYSWSPTAGTTFVNGNVAIAPGGNRIFGTIWDGGGVDTYDLSNYTSNLTVDLNPGGHSVFSSAQLAYLGGGPNGGYARGNVFNALLFIGDARSHIENANGGSGNDVIRGNVINNTLNGNAGADTLYGESGNDVINGGDGNDWIEGGYDVDTVNGGAGNDTFAVRLGQYADNVTGGTGIDLLDFSAVTFYGLNVNLAGGVYNFTTPHPGPYTVTGVENVNGSNFADTIIGDGTSNTINANDGNDNAQGGDGDDSISGGSGADTLQGGAGNDVINGGDEDDLIQGGDGHDTLTAGSGRDQVYGDAGNDRYYIEVGWTGGLGEAFFGGAGVDTFDASTVIFTPFAAYVNLQDGLFYILGSGSGQISLSSVENAIGTDENDWIIGSGENNVLTLGAGNDQAEGLGGNDTILGGDGNDAMRGGAGADVLNGGAGTDIASYADSTAGVSVYLTSGTGSGGDAQGDTLTGFENINGSNHADLLVGNAGANVLRGLNGNDALQGGLGADTLNGEGGTDIASYSDSAAAVTVNLATGTGVGGTAQGDTLLAIENVNGSNQSDFLVGNSGINVLRGLNGNDVLQGGLAADALNGEGGTDTASYSDSAAAVTVNLATGTGLGASAQGDTLLSIENVNGSNFNDVLTGSAGANVLRGMSGKDTLTGGAGADRFYYAALADSVVGANADRITDFSHAQGDRIDLSALDASTGAAGNQAFTFIGTAAYTGVAGQLHYVSSGGVTTIGGDVNGDSLSDFYVTLTGAIALVAADFVL